MTHRQNPTQTTLTMYLDSHNTYVQQLHATNAMMETYHLDTIPQLNQELEDIYNDLCATVSDVVLHSADLIATKVSKAYKLFYFFISLYAHFIYASALALPYTF